MRTILGLLVFVAVSGCAASSHQQQPMSLEQGLAMAQQAAQQKALLESFTKLAAVGNVDGLVEAFAPAARQQVGDAVLRDQMTNDVIPFFKDFREVDSHENISGASFPDGRTGLIHYGYVVTNSAVYKPWTIAFVANGSGPSVAFVNVGECVRDRHPVNKGRCD